MMRPFIRTILILIVLVENLYTGEEGTEWTERGENNWLQVCKAEEHGFTLSLYLFNL